MKIVSYTKSSTNEKNGVGGGGSSSSSEIQNPVGTRGDIDRDIWGQHDSGDDIDGSMTVNGNVNIKVIADKNYENDDDGDGEDEEYETGGGNLFVDLKVTAKELEITDSAYINKHLYINHSHNEHTTNKMCVSEILKNDEDAIKANADNIKKNADEISGLKTRMSSAETAIDSLDVNMQMAETAIKNNADEIASLKNRTTATETAIANYLPIGSIIMFSGTMAEIPEGWAICNGENGTPNLIGKFIKAWTSAGQTGGSNSVTLSASNLPEIKLHVDNDKIKNNSDWNKRLNKYVPALDEVGEYVFDKGGSTHWTLYTGYEEGDKGLMGVKYTTILSDVEDYMYVGEKNSSQSAVTIEPEYYSLIYIMKVS